MPSASRIARAFVGIAALVATLATSASPDTLSFVGAVPINGWPGGQLGTPFTLTNSFDTDKVKDNDADIGNFVAANGDWKFGSVRLVAGTSEFNGVIGNIWVETTTAAGGQDRVDFNTYVGDSAGNSFAAFVLVLGPSDWWSAPALPVGAGLFAGASSLNLDLVRNSQEPVYPDFIAAVQAVPEPNVASLAGIALLASGLARLRRRRG